MNWLFGSALKTTMVAPERALAGRDRYAYPIPTTHTVLGTPLQGPWPEGTEVLYVAMGCFWGAERTFWKMPGVVTTAVGYQGGFTPFPTYEETCTGLTGHTEIVMVAYDPTVVSAGDLLRTFWESHDPTQGYRQGNDVGTQYRSAIYTTTPEQELAARSTRDEYQPRLTRSGFGDDHHRDPVRRRGRHVLLRRGLPPAVPRQEPERVLRPGRHGRLLPASDRRLTSTRPARRPPSRAGRTRRSMRGWVADVPPLSATRPPWGRPGPRRPGLPPSASSLADRPGRSPCRSAANVSTPAATRLRLSTGAGPRSTCTNVQVCPTGQPSECPSGLSGATRSRTSRLSSGRSGNPPRSPRSHTSAPSTSTRNTPPVAGRSATSPSSRWKVVSSSCWYQAARRSQRHCVQ